MIFRVLPSDAGQEGKHGFPSSSASINTAIFFGRECVHPIAKVNAFTRGMLVSNGTLRIQEVREVSAK